jgi:hypothetical protein
MDNSIADHILDGSIVIDSTEAFASVLKEFPGRPELLRVYADLLAAKNDRTSAVEHYARAAQGFLNAGRLLRAWVAKSLQWQLQRPARHDLLGFHRAIASTPHNGAPVDDFVQKLAPRERMAVFSRFRRICVPAGTTLLKAGDPQANLHLVVSGVLKEDCYEMVTQKSRPRREACRVLWEGDSFGDIYPFADQSPSQSHVAARKRSELIVISRQRLIRVSRRHPKVESGIIRLCRIRSEKPSETASAGVRKGQRYPIPIRMRLEVLPDGSGQPPVILDGSSRDLSVSGVSFIPEKNGQPPDEIGGADADDFIDRNVHVIISADSLSVSISGRIVRRRKVVVNGHAIKSFGIQFSEMPPRLRGAFFAFADGARDCDPPHRR